MGKKEIILQTGMDASLPANIYESGMTINCDVIGKTIKARKIGETKDVVVRVISLKDLTEDVRVDFVKKIRSLKGIYHPHLIEYTNIYTSNHSMFIEMKHLAEKPIDTYVRSYYRDNAGGIPEVRLYNIVNQLAKGIDYLHKGCEKCILHGNLGLHNIFYKQNNILITDYGLYLPFAKIHNEKLETGSYPDPPELQASTYNNSTSLTTLGVDHYTTKTDIWFLGCIILDLCAHRLDRSNKLEVFKYFDNYLLKYSPDFREIVKQCFCENPLQRPDAADLIRCTNNFIISLKSAKANKEKILGNDIYLTTTSRLQLTLQHIEQLHVDEDQTTCSTWSNTLTISRLHADLLPRKTKYYYDLFLQWETHTALLLTARRIEDNIPVILEGLDFKGLTPEKIQLCIHRIKQARDNSCPNIAKIHRVEQWKDKCYCEMEYPESPTLRAVMNEIFRANLCIPESFIWNVLLDVSTGLLHLLELEIPYLALCSFNILITNTKAILTNIGSACLNLSSSLSSNRIVGSFLHLLMEFNEVILNDTPENTLDHTYSQDLKELIKHIKLVSESPDSYSLKKFLTLIKDASLQHHYSYDITPFPPRVPPWLIPLIESENIRALKENIERFHTCPPSALMYAIKRRKLTSLHYMCKLISKLKLLTHIPRQFGVIMDEPTSLMINIKESVHVDILSECCEGDLLMRQHNGITALMIAAYMGKHKQVAHLLAEMGIQSDSGVTALMFAVTQRHKRCVELLLPEMGMQQTDGTTALMLAVQVRDHELINILLPEKHLRNFNGITAYDMAMSNELYEYAQLLMLPINEESADELVERRSTGEKSEYQLILVNERKALPPGKYSNLMLAACKDDVNTINKYKKSEAGLISIEGKTALMIAAELGHTASVQRLAQVECGFKTTDGDTAIFMAIRNDNYKCVSILCQYEGDLTNRAGETPLVFAQRMGHTKCIQALINGAYKSHHLSEGSGIILRKSKKSHQTSRLEDSDNHSSLHQLQKPSHSSEERGFLTQTESTEEYITVLYQNQQGLQKVPSCLNNTINHHKEEEIGTNNHSKGIANNRESLKVEELEKHSLNIDNIYIREEVIQQNTEVCARDSEINKFSGMDDSNTEKDQPMGTKQKKKSGTNIRNNKLYNQGKGLKKGQEYFEASCSTSDSSVESAIVNADEPINIEVICPENFKDYESRMAFLEPLQKRKAKKPRAVKTKTNLIIAAEKGDYEGIKKSLKMDIRRSYDGLTALMVAVKADNLTLISLLARYEYGLGQADGTTALMMAAENGLINATYILIERDAGLIDKKGNTALLRLLSSPCPQTCVQILAKVEGQITRKDGQTPLMVAIEAGNSEGVEALVPVGTKLFNRDGQTALMFAAMKGRAEYVEMLMPYEERMVDKKGMTALMYAAAAGHVECVKLLIKQEKGMQSKQRCTALHYAVESNRVACVKVLLDDAEDIPNGRGLKCLSIAKTKRFHECAELLSTSNRNRQED